MVSFKTVIAICLGATLCVAQIINITGVVKESGGANITDATVKLIKANITTTTVVDGRFIITNTPTGTIHNGSAVSCPVGRHQIGYSRNSLTINSTEQSMVGIHVYNISGRQVLSERHSMQAGRHTIPIQKLSDGLHVFKISINNEQHLLKSVTGGSIAGNLSFEGSREFVKGFAKKAGSMSGNSVAPDTTKTIKDTVVISKEGFITQRRYMRDSIADLGTITLITVVDTARDYEGNEYLAIRIGNQVWTTTNLISMKYNDGTDIPHAIESGVAGGTTGWRNSTTGAYCYYDNNPDYKVRYGALYNWYAVNTGKLAPSGWRVPTDAEWDTLQNYLIANGYNWDGSTTGNKITKSMAAQTDWKSYTGQGAIGNDLSKNNVSGFSALPGRSRDDAGNFNDGVGRSGYWWSATEYDVSFARCRILEFFDEALTRGGGHKGFGFSVRLLRD